MAWLFSSLKYVFLQYVGYARKYVHPKIGPEAAQVLQVGSIRLGYIRKVM